MRGDDADPRLRERAVAGRRGRDRALPRWPLRVRRRRGGDAITIFTRDAATGRLLPLAGAAGCLRAEHAGCTPVTGIDSPSSIAVSPDGTSLYVTSSAGTLTSFQRNPETGTLTQMSPGSGCLSDVALADCGVVDGLARAPPSPSRPTARP